MKLRIGDCAAALIHSLALAVPASAIAAPAPAGKWQLVGKTYNSVMFLDLSSVGAEATKSVRVMRVSGQPDSDGWRSVTQQIRVGCADKSFVDEGSTTEKANGAQERSPPAMKSMTVPTRGVYSDLFETVCHDRRGVVVTDPQAWTRRNFKPGS